MAKQTTRLRGRLIRSLRPWDQKADGPFIEVGTLVEAFPFLPGTIWYGALADTRADGHRPRMTPGIEGRTYQGWRIVVLARGLERWIVEQNPHLDAPYIRRLVDDLLSMEDRRRRDARAASAKGAREAAAEKRAAKPETQKAKASKAPKITSTELFRVW